MNFSKNLKTNKKFYTHQLLPEPHGEPDPEREKRTRDEAELEDPPSKRSRLEYLEIYLRSRTCLREETERDPDQRVELQE